MTNLQPRQKHLKKVTDRLKSLAQIFNIIAIYTNHVRASFDSDDKLIPQGGNVLSHASDIRIRLEDLDKEEQLKYKNIDLMEQEGLRVAKASVVDCGFLPNLSGHYLIGPFGIGDSAERDNLFKQVKLINKKGYICVDSTGEELKPLSSDRDKLLEDMRNKLYSS